MKLRNQGEAAAVAAGGVIMLGVGLLAHVAIGVLIGVALLIYAGLNAWTLTGRKL